jgi:AraC-like DNA-binding protein
MGAAPTIHFNEFSHYTTHSEIVDEFKSIKRNHPDFGSWKELFIDLGNIRVFEHRADLRRNVNVLFDQDGLHKYVHHCISLEGVMAANFIDCNFSAKLRPQTFHNLLLPGRDYYLGMGNQFVNVHIEVNRDYYQNLLCDSEKWAAELKEKISGNEVYYPGEFSLSLQMAQTIHSIFNSPLSGSLKKLVIESKVHELIALQLHHCNEHSQSVIPNNQRDLFHAIRQYLISSFLEDHSLQKISRHFGINEFTLKKGFKETFNSTVFDFIHDQRMNFAHQQLLDTRLSVNEISTQVGYKYPNHFSSAFKRKFGFTPASLKN